MHSRELQRWLRGRLRGHGCTFETQQGGSGHMTVWPGSRRTQLPMHGSRKELGTGLVAKIKKDPGLG